MRPKFKEGDRVHLSSNSNLVGIIVNIKQTKRGYFDYQVFFGGNDKQDSFYPEDSLEKHKSQDDFVSAFEDAEFSNRTDFLRFLILEKIRKPLSDNIYTFYSSRTDFQVHQFKPVLKFIPSVNQRLLIADEVGLGKTIEAGIILTELQARHQGLSRVLIVCPAALLEKWEAELRRRFGENFAILRSPEFSDFLNRYEQYGDNEKLKGIVSLQTLRARNMLERLENLQVNFDLVIVDESHHMKNSTTNSSLLGEILSEHADAFIMLSATPLHLGTEDLFNQLHILAPHDFPDFTFFRDLIEPNQYVNAASRSLKNPQEAAKQLRMVEITKQRQRFQENPNYAECLSTLENGNLTTIDTVKIQKQLTDFNTLSHIFTRTRRKDVSTDVNFPQRQAFVLDVNFSEEEKALYDAVTNWVISRYQDSSIGLSFAKIMPQRQVSSCIPVMKSYFENLLSTSNINAPSAGDGDSIDDSLNEQDYSLNCAEIKAVRCLLDVAKRVGDQDTKFGIFLHALRNSLAQNPNAKIIVFSFFKRTLDYLSRRLSSAGIPNAVIHGDVSMKDRQKRVRKFWNDHRLTVLLSSEVGGEGLDLQVASVIFNYDLPWNPMRVEQRIGRLDRYGQENDNIFIYNFSMKGTIDDIILSRLYGRIDLFQRYIGDLEAILGNQVNELFRELFDPNLTDAGREAKADKVGENLLRQQQELELFEQESEGFLGQDEFFTKEISRIRDTRRFVTADEVRFFLESFLESNSGSTLRRTKSGRQNVFVLKTNQEFHAFFEAYTPNEDGKKNISNRLNEEHGMLITFDSAEACKDENLIFVTIHNPLIKAIVKFMEKDSQESTLPLGRLRINSYNSLHGNYFLFIYLLEKTAANKNLQLVPILVSTSDSNDFHFQSSVTESILGKLFDGQELNEDFEYAKLNIKSAESVAADCITMFRQEEEDQLNRSNEILLNNRINSIRQSLQIKENRILQTIEKLNQSERPDKRILRLHQGRIRNLKQKADREIRKWEEKRKVSVGYKRIAGALIYFS